MVDTPPHVIQANSSGPTDPPDPANVQLDMTQAMNQMTVQMNQMTALMNQMTVQMDQMTTYIDRLGPSPQVKSIPGGNFEAETDYIQWAGCPEYLVRVPQFAPRFASQFNQRPKFLFPQQPWTYQPMYPRFRPNASRAVRPSPIGPSVVPGLTVAGWSQGPGFVQIPQYQPVQMSQMRPYRSAPASQTQPYRPISEPQIQPYQPVRIFQGMQGLDKVCFQPVPTFTDVV